MQWSLGLAAWIVQDGNYGDFHRDQRIEVAVEFAFDEAPVVTRAKPHARHLDGEGYDIVGRVVLMRADVWVLDVGDVLVFQERRPSPQVQVGDLVTGRAYLGVDPFFYFERLALDPGVPPLIYTWDVVRVLCQVAPFLQEGNTRYRDPSKLGWREVHATNAWSDDGGNAEYLLECRLLAIPPKRTSATAC